MSINFNEKTVEMFVLSRRALHLLLSKYSVFIALIVRSVLAMIKLINLIKITINFGAKILYF